MRYTILVGLAALGMLGLNGSPGRANYSEAALVQSWYRQFLRRDAEPAGFNDWMAVLRCQGPEAVQAGILGSEEYYHGHGCSPEGFVAGLYADVLGRTACAPEIHGWVCNLRRGDRVRLAQDFLCAARTELAQRGFGGPVGVYQPAPVAAPPAFGGAYGFVPYQGVPAYRALKQQYRGSPFAFR